MEIDVSPVKVWSALSDQILVQYERCADEREGVAAGGRGAKDFRACAVEAKDDPSRLLLKIQIEGVNVICARVTQEHS